MQRATRRERAMIDAHLARVVVHADRGQARQLAARVPAGVRPARPADAPVLLGVVGGGRQRHGGSTPRWVPTIRHRPMVHGYASTRSLVVVRYAARAVGT